MDELHPSSADKHSHRPSQKKGKQPDVQDQSPNVSARSPVSDEITSHGPGSASLASRVAASATSLSHAVMNGQPDAASLQSYTSSAAQKSQGLSGNGSGSGRTSAGFDTASAWAEHAAQNASGGSDMARFGRPQPDTDKGDARYDSFLDDAPPSGSLYQHQPPTFAQIASVPGYTPSAIELQQAEDGTEVLQLLSGPDDVEMGGEIMNPPHDEILPPADRESLRRALFGQGSRSSTNWDNLLNFQPDFLVEGDIGGQQQHMGTSDTAEAEASWLASWRDVLDNYNDEVWGDIGPLAEDAKKELEKAGPDPVGSGQPQDLRALNRLRQVLSHLRGF